MRKTYGSLFILMICTVMALNSYAQKEPSWTFDAPGKINWQQVTPLGNLVINTKDALIGIDTETGNKMWEIAELGNLPGDSYGILPTTFFIEITRGTRTTVVDAWEGRIIFDSRDVGFKQVISKNILYRGGAMLIYGMMEGLKPNMSCFDVNSGEELWSDPNILNKSDKKKSGFGALMQAAQVASDQEEQGGNAFEIIEPDASSFILATSNGIFRVNTKTGDKVWSVDTPQPKGAISASTEYKLIQTPGNDFYFAKSNFIQALKIETGEEVWPTPIKISGIVDQVIAHEKGLITLPKIDPNNTMFAPKANLINYQTGETYWGKKGKGIGLSGTVTGTFFTPEGLVLSMQKDDDAFINILDIESGTLKFSKSEKINGYLNYTEIVGSGLLYITNPDYRSQGEVNIYDLNTGENKFSKSIKSGKPGENDPINSSNFLVANTNDNLFFYSHREQSLYGINKSTGEMATLQSDISFEGKESPNKIEARDKGIALMSEQNIMMVDQSGNKLFQSYYKAPDQPGILKALYGIASVQAALYSAQASMISAGAQYAGSQTSDQAGKAVSGEFSRAFDEAASGYSAYSKGAMAMAKKRFKASAESQDFIFMMVELDKQKTGAAKMFESATFGLIQVNKDTGEVLDLIDMKKEKEPSYDVDGVSQAIYYRLDDSKIVSYKF